jgi:cytochrome c-type biogenesis protein CcmH
MTIFWTLAAALTALSLLFVFVPLWRTHAIPGSGSARQQTDTGISVYRSQLAELEGDRRAGTISDAQFEAARLDLQRNLLEMDRNEAARGNASARSHRGPAGIATLVLLPALAFLIYQQFGAGPAALDPPQRMTAPAQAEDSEAEAEVDSALAALRERLEESPDDPVGWALLGRIYHAMGLVRPAAQAYAQALEHGGEHYADILVDYADVLATLRGGNLEGRPRDLLQRALRIEPDHVKGLWLAGTAAFRAEDYAAAREHWELLARQLPPQSENGATIRANLAEVEARLARQQAPEP